MEGWTTPVIRQRTWAGQWAHSGPGIPPVPPTPEQAGGRPLGSKLPPPGQEGALAAGSARLLFLGVCRVTN